MPTYDTDILLSVFTTTENIFIGSRSKYISAPHPISGKEIEGWKWDEKFWPIQQDIEKSTGYVPTLWDPDLSSIDPTWYQSGVGDEDDLLMTGLTQVEKNDDSHIWAPIIHHGYFYIGDEEWYLFSDDYITQYPSTTNTLSGLPILDLQYDYKTSIPIMALRYRFDFEKGRYIVDESIRKMVEFDEDIHENQFIIGSYDDLPRLTFSSSGIFQNIGEPMLSEDDYYKVEVVGRSTEDELQEFYLTYSPVDRNATVRVWTWGQDESFEEWTVIPSSGVFSTGDIKEVKIDYDRGTLIFGTYTPDNPDGDGHVPLEGTNIGIMYTTTVAVLYEPYYAGDDIVMDEDNGNVNPAYTGITQGFTQTTSYSQDADSIILGSTLPRVNPYIINMGNNVGLIYAEVRSMSGAVVAGQEVNFKILEPVVGTFGGGQTETRAVTNTFGEARVYYSAPTIAGELGLVTNTIEYDGDDTLVTVSGMSDPGTNTSITIMKVHTHDDVLGIPAAELTQYYLDYLEENDIIEDPTPNIPASAEFEIFWRSAKELEKYHTYTPSDLKTGKKTVILIEKNDNTVLDPHTGELDVYGAGNVVLSPLYPTEVTSIGTIDEPIVQIRYSDIHLPLPGSDDTKSYFIVSDAICTLQAYVVNKSTGRQIASNTIQVKTVIPSSVNGSFFASTLNDLPTGLLTKVKDMYTVDEVDIIATSGIEEYNTSYELEKLFFFDTQTFESYYDWFMRTRRADLAGIMQTSISGLEIINAVDAPAEVPLGFRLRSQGLSIASVLDQVTFIDPNDTLVSGYYS